MKLIKKSLFTGKVSEMELPNITHEQHDAWLKMERSERPLVRNFFPNATPDEREFIMTGCTPTEWNEFFSDE